MTITTKKNANGRISAYYVDGIKVRKIEVEAMIHKAARNDEIIYVDYYTGQGFSAFCYSAMKVVFTDKPFGFITENQKLMTEAAAKELGAKIIEGFRGRHCGLEVYLVEMPTEEETAVENKRIESKMSKFEEGKTYFVTWNEDTGRPHTSKYTIQKRTAKNVVINGSRSKIYVSEYDGGSEYARVGYGVYVYAKDVFGEETVKAQAEKEAWWNEQDEIAGQRTIEVDREYAMLEAFVNPEAQGAAVEAEVELANAESKVSEREALIAEFKAEGYKFVTSTEKIMVKAEGTKIYPTTTYSKTYEAALEGLARDAKFYATCPAHDGGFELATIDGEIIAKGDKIVDYEKHLKAKVESSVEEIEAEIKSLIEAREERIGDDIITYRGDKCVRIQSLKYGAIITKCSEFGGIIPGNGEEIVYMTNPLKDDGSVDFRGFDSWCLEDFMQILSERGAVTFEDNAEIESYHQLGYKKAQELREKLLTKEITDAPRMNVINQVEICCIPNFKEICIYYREKSGQFGIRDNRVFLGLYDTPEQIEAVIGELKAAVERGDKEFTFPAENAVVKKKAA